MSDERLAEIRARLEAATPGPWVASEGDGATWVDSVGRNGLLVCNTGVISNRYSTANTRLIANAPADLAYLLAELAAAQARASTLRTKLEQAWIRDAGYQSVIVVVEDGTVSIAAENWPFVRSMLAQYGKDSAALAEGA